MITRIEGQLANAYNKFGQQRRAKEWIERCLAIDNSTEDPIQFIVEHKLILARIYHALANYNEAISEFSQVEEQSKTINREDLRSAAIFGKAGVFVDIGLDKQAIASFTIALQLCRAQNNVENESQTLFKMAICHCKLGNYSEAIKCSKDAAEVYPTDNTMMHKEFNEGRIYRHKMQVMQGKISLEENDRLQNLSLLCFQKALQIADKINDPKYNIYCLGQIARINISLKNFGEAEEQIVKAISESKLVNFENTESFADLKLLEAEVFLNKENLNSALESYHCVESLIYGIEANIIKDELLISWSDQHLSSECSEMIQSIYLIKNDYVNALEAAERNRSRSLLREVCKRANKSLSNCTYEYKDYLNYAIQTNSTLLFFSDIIEDSIFCWVISSEGTMKFLPLR